MCISPQHDQCSSGQLRTSYAMNKQSNKQWIWTFKVKKHFGEGNSSFHQTFTALSPNFHHTIPTLSPNFRHTFTKSPPHFTKLSPHQHTTWHDGRDKLDAMSGTRRLYLIKDPWHDLLVRNKKTYDSFKFLVKSTWGGREWEGRVQDKLLNVCNLFKCPGTISFWILPCLKGKQMTFIAHVCHPSQYHGVKISRVAIVHICRSNQCFFFGKIDC